MEAGKTQTEEVLPRMVDAVQEDFAWAVDRLTDAIARLQGLEEQLRHDHKARTCCHGKAEALQSLKDELVKESADYAVRVLPDGQGASERPTLTVERIA